jgi:hypothetical protein
MSKVRYKVGKPDYIYINVEDFILVLDSTGGPICTQCFFYDPSDTFCTCQEPPEMDCLQYIIPPNKHYHWKKVK